MLIEEEEEEEEKGGGVRVGVAQGSEQGSGKSLFTWSLGNRNAGKTHLCRRKNDVSCIFSLCEWERGRISHLSPPHIAVA